MEKKKLLFPVKSRRMSFGKIVNKYYVNLKLILLPLNVIHPFSQERHGISTHVCGKYQFGLIFFLIVSIRLRVPESESYSSDIFCTP